MGVTETFVARFLGSATLLQSDNAKEVRRALPILAVCFLAVFLIYRKTPVSFLRAESGWYLLLSHSDEGIQRQFLAQCFGTSYGGHYTPLAFLAEFETAKLFGTNAALWRSRQLLALALLGAVVFALTEPLARIFAFTPWRRATLSFAITTGALFQPLMLDLVSWPFTFLQLLWSSLTTLSLLSLLKLAASGEKTRWAWTAALSGYAAMHVLGLGFATALAVAAVLGGVLLATRGSDFMSSADRRQVSFALIVLACLATVHGWAMIHLSPTEQLASADATRAIAEGLKLWLGFVANLAGAGVGSFTATAVGQPIFWSIAHGWPYGILLLTAWAAAVVRLAQCIRRKPTQESLAWFTLQAFSFAGFVGVVVLFAAREVRSGGTLAEMAMRLALFTTIPRYVVPLHFLLIGVALSAGVWSMRRAPRVSSALFCAVALAAVAAQAEFQSTGYKYIAPLWRISHASAWQLVLSMVSECRAAGLPVPNIPLKALTQEFDTLDLEGFQPLVRDGLALRADVKIEYIPWEQSLGEGRHRYNAVPSLPLLEQKLRISPGGD